VIDTRDIQDINLIRLGEILRKSKYIKRTGSSGSYKYWYRDKKTGKLVEGKKNEKKKNNVREKGTSNISFNEWYNEIADMPEKVDGEWVDLETGLPYEEKDIKIKQVKTDDHLREIESKKWKLSDLKNRCERFVNSEKISIERAPKFAIEAIEATKIAMNFGEKLLSNKGKKVDFIRHAELNSHASKLMNDAIIKEKSNKKD